MKQLIFIAILAAASAITAAAQQPTQPLPFSAARQAGNTLYVSGQVSRAPNGKVVLGSATAETNQIMENIGRILKEHGYTFDDVVRATVYLRDIEDYAEMNAAYRKYFKKDFPARACIGGIDLVANYTVEISCIAYKEK